MTRPDLLNHQAQAITWARQVQRGLLADEPGLGKTRSAIESFDGGNVLVIAPGLILSSGTWTDEVARWSNHPDRYTYVPYTSLNEREWTGALRADGTPNKSATRATDRLRPEYRQHWDAVILDEAHYIKGRGTHWTKAAQQATKNADQVLLLTGTPIPNWAHEMFTLLQVLRPQDNRRGGPLGSYWRWAREWFDVSASYYNDSAYDIGGLKACYPECTLLPAREPCEHYHRFMTDNLGDRVLRRLRDDVLDLPPITETTVQTPMDKPAARAYRELKSSWVTDLEDGNEIVAWSQGAKNVMLDRLTTSPWLLGDRTSEPAGGKFETLRYDLANRSRPTLVLAHYQDTVEACARVAESTGASVGYIHGRVPKAQAGKTIRDFKSGKIDVLVGSLETVSEGLTLTVADMAIFVEKSYKPSRNEQATRRIHRIGQDRPVTVRDYVAPNSVDSGKRKLLATKTDHQMRALTIAELLSVA